jgi:hypothetical protein
MVKYENSKTIDAEFKRDFAGWTAEHVLMKGDEIFKKSS